MISTETSQICPVCSQPASYDREFLLDDFSINTCVSCGSGIMLPRRGAGELEALHSSEDYFDHPYFEARREITPHIAASFERRRQWIAEALPQTEGRALLDVGCDVGLFVRWAQDRMGMKGTGIDIFRRVVEIGREAGLDLHHGRVETFGLEPRSFDVICGFDLIEHVDDPVGWTSAAFNLLKPGGILILETPNYGGLVYTVGRVAGRIPGFSRFLLRRLWPRFHVQYFTAGSLRSLAERQGMNVEKMQARELTAGETALPLALKLPILALFGIAVAIGRPSLLTLVARRPYKPDMSTP